VELCVWVSTNCHWQIIRDSEEQQEAKRFSTHEMTTKLAAKKSLVEHIVPDFAVGCRRPTPGNGYLEALTDPKVRVVTDEISEIVPEGIKLVTGEVIKVDTFICATGFDISFAPRFPLVGRNGINLATQWKSRPEAYLSMAAANIPNHFSMFLVVSTSCQSLTLSARSVSRTQLSCGPWLVAAGH
jgi:cation diffusion facilitator CzcD-associated flavoprotein CzcO